MRIKNMCCDFFIHDIIATHSLNCSCMNKRTSNPPLALQPMLKATEMKTRKTRFKEYIKSLYH